MVKITDKIYVNPKKILLIEAWEDYYDHTRQMQLEEPVIVGSRIVYENRQDAHIKGVTPEQIYNAIIGE